MSEILLCINPKGVFLLLLANQMFFVVVSLDHLTSKTIVLDVKKLNQFEAYTFSSGYFFKFLNSS